MVIQIFILHQASSEGKFKGKFVNIYHTSFLYLRDGHESKEADLDY